jgi:hypothetical protein
MMAPCNHSGHLLKRVLSPLANAACFSMIDASPAELPVDYYAVEQTAK